MADGENDRRLSETESSPGSSSRSDALASWKRIQTNTFIRWANEQLKEVGGEPMEDLETDLSDGVRLIALVEALSRKKFPRRYSRNPSRRNQKLENVTLALEYLERDEGIRIVNIDSSDIVDHNVKLILGLMWSLILHYSISAPTWEGETNSVKEKKQDLTPKQRLLMWIQNKIPEQHVTNFTSNWNDGRNIGALVDSIAPGICPDWHLWNPDEAVENSRKAMTIAEEWLNVPQLITPDELTDPKLDELSAMTYLAQFPNARLKSPICVRQYGACTTGPGAVGLPLEFSIDSLNNEIFDARVKVTDPNGVEKQCKVMPAEDSKSCLFSFHPKVEGKHVVSVVLESLEDSPEHTLPVYVQGSVFASGPGIQAKGVTPMWKTSFEIVAENLVVTHVEVTITQPDVAHGSSLCSDVYKSPSGQWKVEYTPLVEGLHIITVLINGGVIHGSPFNVFVSSEGLPQISLKGRGIQPSGVRVGDNAVVILQVDKSSEESEIEADASSSGMIQHASLDSSSVEVSITDPDGTDVPMELERLGQQLRYTYKPQKVGKFTGKVTYKGQNVNRSPFVVNVSPVIERKSRVFGPGLCSGIVGYPAYFTIDQHEDESLTGVSVDGPCPVEVIMKENDDGSKDAYYIPMAPGEHAVHIFCNDEDIPGSPFMVDVLPAMDGFDLTKVLAYGSGLKETGVTVDEWAEFIVDTTLVGHEAELCIEAFDDEYNSLEVLEDEGDKIGAVECRYKPQKPGQHRIFISYGGVCIIHGPFRVQVENNPASYPVIELPVEVTQVELVGNQASDEEDESSTDLQASQVKAFGEGLHSGYAGHSSSFLVVMSECSAECLGVAVDGPCKVEMDCHETKEGYKFTYVPRVAGEFLVSVNYAGKYPIHGSPFHVLIKEITNLYRVRVFTGNKLFAGTDANVFITLFGEIGDTGTVQLKYSRTHLNKFERNQMDEFFVEAVNIGDLRKIKIGHDNLGKVGASWFLDRVEIESPLLMKHWVFPFRRWLSKGDLAVEMIASHDADTGNKPITFSNSQEMKIEEVEKSSAATVSCENPGTDQPAPELVPSSSDSPGAYRIHVFTGNKLFAGTDASVHIQLFGDEGDTGILELKSSKHKKNKFERNQKDEFIFDIQDVGEIEKIRIGHDNSGLFGSSWFLERVEVESILLAKKWFFPFKQWLSREKLGCHLEAEIYPQADGKESQKETGTDNSDHTDLADANVKASGPGLEKQLSINVRTSFSVDVSEADPGNLLLLSIQGPTEPCAVNMTYEGSGIYNVSYHPREKGVHVISIKWGKKYIEGSPFLVTVM